MRENYDPENVSQYFGKKFRTKSGSVYEVREGKVIKNEMVIGTGKVALIAGLKHEFLSGDYYAIPLLIQNHGEEVSKGLCLAVVVELESKKQEGTRVILSTPIEEITKNS